MNTALLVLRIIPGLLLMGHGLQKLVPARYSPPLLRAAGHRRTGAGFHSLGIRPGVVAAVLAGSAEVVGGFEYPLVLLTAGFVITALGAGSLSLDSWLGVDNRAGINWTIDPAARSAIALAVGLAGGLVVAMASWASKRTSTHAGAGPGTELEGARTR